jgi:hypothetical protein
MSDFFCPQPPSSGASSRCELGARAQTNPPSMRCKEVISMPGGKWRSVRALTLVGLSAVVLAVSSAGPAAASQTPGTWQKTGT